MRRLLTTPCAALLLALLPFVLLPARASARAATPPPPPPPDFAALTASGDVTVREAEVHVQCGSFDFIDVYARCRVVARLALRSDAGGSLAPDPTLDGDVFLVDGRPLTSPRVLAPGAEISVYLRSEREISTSTDVEESPYVLSAAFTRHPLAGESRSMGSDSSTLRAPLIRGARLVGSMRIDARSAGPVRVDSGAGPIRGLERVVATSAEAPMLHELSLRLERDRTHEGPLANGGPLVLLGMQLGFEGDAETLSIAAGYELIVADSFFVSAAIGTDGTSLLETLVLEIAAPDLLYIFPSVAAGVGMVGRQLGPSGPEFALRLRLAASYPVLAGVAVDLDYWPSSGTWTITPALRISL